MIAQGVDLLCICAVDCDGLSRAMTEAKAKGVRWMISSWTAKVSRPICM